MNMHVPRFVLDFLKVGVIGFGGGSALIPVVEREVVVNRGLLSNEEYLKHTVVANITPGALPVKLAATCGMQLHGAAAAFLAALAVAAPGTAATVVLVHLFSTFGGRAMDFLNHAGIGVTVFIAFLLCHYVVKTVRSGNLRVNALICLLAFAATGGKEAREIIELALHLAPHSLGASLLNISMIHLMIIAICCIALFQLTRRVWPRIVGCGLAFAYAVSRGDVFLARFPGSGATLLLATLCAGTLVFLWLQRKRGSAGSSSASEDSPASAASVKGGLRREITVLLLFFPLVSLVPLFLGLFLGCTAGIAEYFGFFGNVVLSTVTSFGGGEAYVSVADSVFVQSGQVDAGVFYNRIVPVANALPGPILIKIASALGYVWGADRGGMMVGVMAALSCFILPIGVCSGLALVVLNFYDLLRESAFVLSLKRFILPVICGSLLSTSLAILCESAKTGQGYGYPARTTLLTMTAGVFLVFTLQRRCRLHDLLLLGICLAAGVSVAVLLP